MRNYLIFIIIFPLLTTLGYPLFSGEPVKVDKIKVLILSGRNNHNWQETTPFLESIFSDAGCFETEITNRPDTLTWENLMKFDAIVSNWNSFPDNKFRWPKETEEGLLKFVNKGGGLVFFHASTTTFYNWSKFKKISTGAWIENTWHGKPDSVKVKIENPKHPITKGLSDFVVFDELWINAEQNKAFKVLGSAVTDSVESKGIEKQPAIFVSNYGKGKIFHTILGHDVKAMNNPYFKTLILRGTEWAATSKVTLPLPDELKTTGISNILQR